MRNMAEKGPVNVPFRKVAVGNTPQSGREGDNEIIERRGVDRAA